MSNILSKIFATILLGVVLYVLCVFFFPEIADRYGSLEINQKIRHIKEVSLQISSPDGSLNIPM